MRYQMGIIALTAVFLTGSGNAMDENSSEKPDDNPKRTKSLHTKSLNLPIREPSLPVVESPRPLKALSTSSLKEGYNDDCSDLIINKETAKIEDLLQTVPVSGVQTSENEAGATSSTKAPLGKSQERKLLKLTSSPTLTKVNKNLNIARLNLADIRTSPPRESVYSARRLSSPKLDPGFLKSEAEREAAKSLSTESSADEVSTAPAPAVAPLSQEVTTPVMTPDDGTASDDSSSS